jgi:rubrerythrin
MGIIFNAKEVLTIAINMEENAVKFYKKAAILHAEEYDCNFLLNMAEMEQEHSAKFKKMQKEFADDKYKQNENYDPLGEIDLYLKAVTDSQRGEGAPSISNMLTGEESLADILSLAIDLEKDSILYYIGLKQIVPPTMGQEVVDEIIEEERSHISIIAKELEKLK